MKKFLAISSFFITGVLLASCGNSNEPETGKEETAHKEEHGPPNTATLTNEQMKSIGVQLGQIEEKQLTASLKANGVLQVPNQNKASINTVYSGVVRSLLIQPGNTVSKGQTIATIANPDFLRVQEEYLGINPRITLAEQEYNRQKELNQGNAGALKNLQAAETELNTLRTRRSSLQQQIQLMGINPASLSNGKLISVLAVRSPINGVVSNVTVKMGSYVDVSTVVAEIVDNSQLHLDLYVYEKDLSKLKNNQLIHFTLTNNPGKEYDAQIYSLGSSFEGVSKAVTVHAKVQGDKMGLIDGMSITAVISLEKATVKAVPTDAIVTYQGQDYVFMQTQKQSDTGLTFEKIPVARGTTDVGYTEITLLKEIPADAHIVVKGAFFVLAKMTNTGEHEE
jgi:RND family efflux transporter MFP subunit